MKQAHRHISTPTAAAIFAKEKGFREQRSRDAQGTAAISPPQACRGFPRNTMIRFAKQLGFVAILVALGGCASTHSPVDTATKIATSPLRDLNLLTPTIPPEFLAVKDNPHLPPSNCDDAREELFRMEQALGLTTPKRPSDRTTYLLNKAQDQAVAHVQGVVNGVVPMRSWVRKLSGAERSDKRSIAAGQQRHAYLKGWIDGHSCTSADPNQTP